MRNILTHGQISGLTDRNHEGKVADYLQEQLSLEETEGGLEVKCCKHSSYTQKVSFRIVF